MGGATKWSSLALLVAGLLSCCAHGVAAALFHLESQSLAPYSAGNYALSPSWRVGVFTKGASEAEWFPVSSRTSPHITVDVTVAGAPHDHVEFVAFSAVELQHQPPGVGVCFDSGQTAGAGTTPAIEPFVFRLRAARNAAGGLRISGTVTLPRTDLMVMGFDACRYIYRNLATGQVSEVAPNATVGPNVWMRELDVSGWHNVVLTGSVDVSNSFGALPGQAYGYVPTFIALLVCAIVGVVVYSGGMTYVTFARVQIVQVAFFAVLFTAAVHYAVALWFFVDLNVTGIQSSALQVAALIIASLRDTLARAWVYLFARAACSNAVGAFDGWSIVIGLLCAGHFLLQLVAASLGVQLGTGTPAGDIFTDVHPDPPAVGMQVLAFCTVAIEVVLAVAAAAAMRVALRHAPSTEDSQSDLDDCDPPPAAVRNRVLDDNRRRRKACFGVIVVGVAYAAIVAVWWLYAVSGLIQSSFATLSPALWRQWWLRDCISEIAFALAMSILFALLFPTPRNCAVLSWRNYALVYETAELHCIGSTAPGTRRSGEFSNDAQPVTTLGVAYTDEEMDPAAPVPALSLNK